MSVDTKRSSADLTKHPGALCKLVKNTKPITEEYLYHGLKMEPWE